MTHDSRQVNPEDIVEYGVFGKEGITFESVVSVLNCFYAYQGKAKEPYICFSRKHNGSFENLFSFTLRQFTEHFDKAAPFLEQDAYFCINGMFRCARFLSKVTNFPGVVRNEKSLCYLNACYVDLDIARSRGTAEQCQSIDTALAELNKLTFAGHLPPGSMMVQSGRGLYLMWLLRNLGEQCQSSYGENLVLYKRVERAIVERLSCLAADVSAVDASRLLRVPGTLHGTTQERALFKVYARSNEPQTPLSYTLKELACLFGVKVEEEIPRSFLYEAPRPVKAKGSAPQRSHGPKTRDRRRAEDILIIEREAKGWRKGHRRARLQLYAGFLVGAGVRKSEVLKAVQAMALRCRPCYPSDPNDMPLNAIVAQAFAQSYTYRSETLCQKLGVTADFARQFNLRSIVPAEVKAERQAPPGGERGHMTHQRRTEMQGFIKSFGLQSSRTIAKYLQERGHKVSPWTVNRDLAALGYDTASQARQPGRRKAPLSQTHGDEGERAISVEQHSGGDVWESLPLCVEEPQRAWESGNASLNCSEEERYGECHELTPEIGSSCAPNECDELTRLIDKYTLKID